MWHMTMATILQLRPDLHAKIQAEHPLWTPDLWVEIRGEHPPKLLEFVDPVLNEAMQRT